jgi:NAD(P)-dependent dehydrogenase (short-subunit alcohol dehydrogenase family)
VTPPAILSVPPYVAAKFAVVGLTKEAAGEYGQYGIRVNCIAPGFHHGTRLGESGRVQSRQEKPPETRPEVIERTPLRRTAEPEELKGLLLYLASDSSSFVTGQIIAHDGGLSVW